MPQGAPAKKEKKKPKKDALAKGVRSTVSDQPTATAVETCAMMPSGNVSTAAA